LIAGEALAGLVIATFNFRAWPLPEFFKEPSYIAGIVVMFIVALVLIRIPMANAGRPDEPAPPAAMM
jgi:hypothetical protein